MKKSVGPVTFVLLLAELFPFGLSDSVTPIAAASIRNNEMWPNHSHNDNCTNKQFGQADLGRSYGKRQNGLKEIWRWLLAGEGGKPK